MNTLLMELWPYFLMVLVGYLPNEVWRVFGLVLARGLNEDSQVVVWSRAVATAILAGVIAKLVLFSTGALATIPLSVRVIAAVFGFSRISWRQTIRLRWSPRRRGRATGRRFPFRPLVQPAAMAAARALACSARTSGFSFSLAGGFMTTPALRGMT